MFPFMVTVLLKIYITFQICLTTIIIIPWLTIWMTSGLLMFTIPMKQHHHKVNAIQEAHSVAFHANTDGIINKP